MLKSPEILIVDDEPENLRLLDSILRLQGYRIRQADDGPKALQCAQEDKPQLILLDVRMPGMDGYQVCRNLKANEQLKDIPVIFLSAFPELLAKIEAFEAGAVDFIVKPFKISEVLARIETHLSLQQQKINLTESDRMKDEFLASMSHELRTPLNAILGMSEALQEEVYGPLTPKQASSLKIIEDSGSHLLDLINDILDVARIGAKKLPIQIASVSVEGVFAASLRLIKEAAQKKKLKVSSNIDNSVTTIMSDERRVKQILVNLLTNAVKFTDEGGSIGFDVQGFPDDGVVKFSVWDTGIGISEQEASILFQPFVQLDSSLSRKHSGTGLGLSLTKSLTEMLGGGIDMESESGKGSRFTVTLPWNWQEDQPEPVEDKTPAAPAISLSEIKNKEGVMILLAEDNQQNVTTYCEYLKVKGYRMEVAGNGIEAIKLAKEKRPDIILMDIQMPVMDGLAAIRRIRTEEDIKAIPIIALTALAMPGDRERTLQAGADEYMSKPVRLKELEAQIQLQIKNSYSHL